MSALDRIKAKRELKPCPFCKSNDTYLIASNAKRFVRVLCKKCRAFVNAPNLRDAVAAWNGEDTREHKVYLEGDA